MEIWAAMRIGVSSWATTEPDIDRSVAAMLEVASKHRAGGALTGF
jgi:hypothetical protein